MDPISKEETARILELYAEGKDHNRPGILTRIYAPEARVLFDLQTPDIAFPPEIRTNHEIAEVLSADFNRRFVSPRTYYLEGGRPDPEKNAILNHPWLVIMREAATGSARVGWGLYDWFFSFFEDQNPPAWKIVRHHIAIWEMMEIEDKAGALLNTLQSALSYPWPTPAEVRNLPERWPPLRKKGFPPQGKDEGGRMKGT